MEVDWRTRCGFDLRPVTQHSHRGDAAATILRQGVAQDRLRKLTDRRARAPRWHSRRHAGEATQLSSCSLSHSTYAPPDSIGWPPGASAWRVILQRSTAPRWARPSRRRAHEPEKSCICLLHRWLALAAASKLGPPMGTHRHQPAPNTAATSVLEDPPKTRAQTASSPANA